MLYKRLFSTVTASLGGLGAYRCVDYIFREQLIAAPTAPYGIVAGILVFSIVKMIFAYLEHRRGG